MSNSPNTSRLFSHPFSAAYWKSAARELKNPRVLVLAALFIALDLAVSSLFIPIPGAQNLRIYFSYFVKSLGGMIYGPVVGMMTGFIGDITAWILRPDGPFFAGYTLTAVLSGLTYALFFYRAKVGPLRVILCKLCVNLFLNVGLGCIWSAMLYGKGYYYYFATSIVKNVLLLPVEVILLFLFFAVMTPILARMGIVPPAMVVLRRNRDTGGENAAGT